MDADERRCRIGCDSWVSHQTHLDGVCGFLPFFAESPDRRVSASIGGSDFVFGSRLAPMVTAPRADRRWCRRSARGGLSVYELSIVAQSRPRRPRKVNPTTPQMQQYNVVRAFKSGKCSLLRLEPIGTYSSRGRGSSTPFWTACSWRWLLASRNPWRARP